MLQNNFILMELSATKVTGYDVKRGTLLQYMTKADLPSPFVQ